MFNYKLHKAMKDKGLTGKKLSELSGIENSRLSRILNGKLKIKREEKKKLSKVLGVAQKNLF